MSSRTVLMIALAALLGAVICTAPALAGRIKLSKQAMFTIPFGFATGVTDGGCSAPWSLPPVPSGKLFAVQDIVCTVYKGSAPLPNQETYRITLYDSAGCSGTTVLDANFTSEEGLRYSPSLALGVGEGMSILALRATCCCRCRLAGRPS